MVGAFGIAEVSMTFVQQTGPNPRLMLAGSLITR